VCLCVEMEISIKFKNQKKKERKKLNLNEYTKKIIKCLKVYFFNFKNRIQTHTQTNIYAIKILIKNTLCYFQQLAMVFSYN